MGSATTVFTMQVSLLIVIGVVGVATASTWQAAPYTLLRERRAAQRTRFFTGNSAIDAGAAGALAGVATQIFNPCTRGGTRVGNKNTNNRIFGGQTFQNGALGFAAGFAGAALAHNALGSPCGR